MSSEPVFAVTGSTGTVGGRVARLLADAGATQVLVGRDPARAPRLEGARPSPPATYGDAAAMRTALSGADVLLFVSGRESAARVAEHAAVVEAAVDAGVARVVYTSFVGAAPDAVFTFARDHAATERALRTSGMEVTVLRDSMYLGALPAFVADDGALRAPAGDGRVGAVAQDDVAAAAAAVLLDVTGAHAGATYDLTGPESLSLEDVAQQLTATTGTPVRYEAETVEQAYASRARYGAPPFELDGWLSSYTAIAAGELDVVTDAVEHLTGRPATSFAQYLAAHPESWAHLRA